MNKEEAKLIAMTGFGSLIKHKKGGIYTVKGFCRVQVFGSWHESILYTDGKNNYARLTDDCEKLSLFK